MKRIFLFAGRIHSGKNFAAEIAKNILTERGASVETMMFAQGVKDGCREDFKQLTDFLNSVAEDCAHDGDEYTAKLLYTEDTNWYEKKTPLTRILLQTYGTEIFRNRVGKDWWTEKLAERVKESAADTILVTDMRFPNECDRLREMLPDCSVVSVLIERNVEDEEREAFANHASETSLDGYEFDEVVDNNGTPDMLEEKLKSLLTKRGAK